MAKLYPRQGHKAGMNGAGMMIGAVDAGSNAIRATVARVSPCGQVDVLAKKRAAVRLGHQVFTQGYIPPARAAEAVVAFDMFRRFFDKHRVDDYRAVATSAVRSASNRRSVLRKIQQSSGLELTTISGLEEARLVRTAVLAAFPKRRSPQLIADLGGGSLELSLLDKRGQLIDSTCLPVGTVRLMEDRGLYGALSNSDCKDLRREIRDRLRAWRSSLPINGDVVLCGGNARAWSRIASSAKLHGLSTIEGSHLKRELNELRRMDIRERKDAYGMRGDRAEVIAIAGVVFACLSDWLDVSSFVVPPLGLLDGVLLDMATARREQRLSA